ncbi:glycosyltransferase family 2 protein [Bacillus sp. 22-7]|uniref:glycosyltransferase family 2 protein n=1 Tax=Bacillus sp. 22-7 TaxID=2709707 RepID=UPI0013D38B19|nr:glycosyltransferase family 2 protein [Bacillus sp. 22-7]
MDISIIMPVYNSEEYLSDAIKSILNQSYENFELILINDGSKDNSGSICDEFAQKDARVVVIHKDNGGISDARNAGLRVAKGEYIAFSDNDDIFSGNLLEDNFKIAKQYDADIVKYGVSYYEISNKSKRKIPIRDLPFQVIDKNGISKDYLTLKRNNIFVYVWDSLIRKDIILDNNLFFDRAFKFGGEDIDFNLSIFKYIKKLVINPDEHYTHFKRFNHSTVCKFSVEKLNPFLLNAKKENELITELKVNRDPELMIESISSYIIQVSYTLNHIDEMTRLEKIEYLKRIGIFERFICKYSFSLFLKGLVYRPKRALVIWLYSHTFYKSLLKICA